MYVGKYTHSHKKIDKWVVKNSQIDRLINR